MPSGERRIPMGAMAAGRGGEARQAGGHRCRALTTVPWRRRGAPLRSLPSATAAAGPARLHAPQQAGGEAAPSVSGSGGGGARRLHWACPAAHRPLGGLGAEAGGFSMRGVRLQLSRQEAGGGPFVSYRGHAW